MIKLLPVALAALSVLAGCASTSPGASAPIKAAWLHILVTNPDTTRYHGLASDEAGNTYVAGQIDGGWTQYDEDDKVFELPASAYLKLVLMKSVAGKMSWIRSMSAPSETIFFSASAGQGRVYASGWVTNQEGQRGYLAAYDDRGNSLWSAVSPVKASAYQVVRASSDAVLVSGYTYEDGQAYFQLAKYDASGNLLWTRNAPDDGQFDYPGLSVDAAGNVVAVYSTFEHGMTDDSLLKFTKDGELAWTRTAANPQGSIVYKSLVSDSQGNTYVSGTLRGDGLFDFGNGMTSEGPGEFLAKYDAAGRVAWIRQPATDPEAPANFESLGLDAQGNLYFAGSFAADIDFGQGKVLKARPQNPSNLLLGSYSPSGEVRWVWTQPGGVGDYRFSVLSVDTGLTVLGDSEEPGVESGLDFGGLKLYPGSRKYFVVHFDQGSLH